MKVLFTDLDGVAGDHSCHAGSIYCRILPDCMAELNRVIAATDCKLVITSAWRYQILRGAMTLEGFENMLATHGLIVGLKKKNGCSHVVGFTRADKNGVLTDRGSQILFWLSSRRNSEKIHDWAVVDDCPPDRIVHGKAYRFEMDLGADQWRLVKTDGTRGMTPEDADKLIDILNRKEAT